MTEKKMKKTEAKVKTEKAITHRLRETGKDDVKLAGAVCRDKDCPVHGNLKTRGKTFEGKVVRKFHKRIMIEFERMIYVRKYERYAKSRTKIHARLPICMEKDINIGDLIQIRECRPLSKIIHFVVVKKIKSAEKEE